MGEMTRSAVKRPLYPLMQPLTAFREHLFDITAVIDVIDDVWLDRVLSGIIIVLLLLGKKRRQMPFVILICI